jgi:hypothetical protein
VCVCVRICRQGVVAFDDFYRSSDLCAAHNVLAHDDYWLSPPPVRYEGPDFDPSADEAESDLGKQYSCIIQVKQLQ